MILSRPYRKARMRGRNVPNANEKKSEHKMFFNNDKIRYDRSIKSSISALDNRYKVICKISLSLLYRLLFFSNLVLFISIG